MLVTQISIDLAGVNRFEYVIAKQADVNSRVIQVQLLDNGKIYVLDDQITARVSIVKPDKKEVLQDCTISDNRVEIVLDKNMLAVAGTAAAEILLTGSDGTITSASFDIKIIATVTGKNAESSNDYASFKDALIAAQKFENRIYQVETQKASKQYVAEEIAKAQLEGAEVDTSNFVTKSDLEGIGGLSEDAKTEIITLFENVVYNDFQAAATIERLKTALNSSGSSSGGSGSGSSGSGGSDTGDLPTSGLMDYFDLRNSEPTVNTGQGLTTYAATVGAGCLFSWSTTTHTASDEYGTKIARSCIYDKDGGTATCSCGTTFTWCFMTYNGLVAASGYFALSNLTAFCAKATYNNTSSSTTTVETTNVSGSSKAGYTTVFVVVNEDNLKIYVNGELYKEYNGADYSDFESWYSKLEAANIATNTDNYFTAMAIYNKALSAVELTEVQAYFETLEVA